MSKAGPIIILTAPQPPPLSFEHLTGLSAENIIILIFSKMSVAKQLCVLCVTEVPFSSFLGENTRFYNARNFPQMHKFFFFFDDSEASVLF